MGNTVTDIAAIRRCAEILLYTDLKKTEIDFVASHPFTNMWFAYDPQTKGLWDLHDQTNADAWRRNLKELIQRADLYQLFKMLNPPYILTFLKIVEGYMSASDLGMILGNFWFWIEQISMDPFVKGKEITRFFQRADKETLMEDAERKIYSNLPDMVTIYRGVTSFNKSRKKALSWTLDITKAQWFANRFDTGTGEVWSMEVPKKRILAYFESRDEAEVIVDLYGYKGEMDIAKEM